MDRRPGRLGSRILVTWIELLVVGLGGMALGTAAGGPVALVAYFLTTLASVGVLLYNVAALVDRKIAAVRAESVATNDPVGDRRA